MNDLPPEMACNLSEIASLEREELLQRLMHFNGRVKLDFTESFLARKSTDQLRHILIAACKYAAETDPSRRT